MGQNELQQTSRDWKYVLAGAVIGGIIISLVFRSFFCFYTFQEPSTKFFFVAISVLLGVFKKQLDQIKDEIIKNSAYFLIGSIGAATIVMFITLATVDLTRNYCVRDFEQLKTMIEMEGEAVIKKDINIIHNIYSADAVISKQDTNEAFQAYIYYSQKFAEEEHCNVNHSDYLVTDYARDQVTLTTSSMGNYGLKGEGCTQAYSNPPGSDLWVFRKIGNEWKIVHFEFNRKIE